MTDVTVKLEKPGLLANPRCEAFMTSATLPPNVLSALKVFGEPQLHTDGELLALAFAPNGTLWSVEERGVLRHWNANTGQQLEWSSLSDMETLWCFSGDTRVLASASDDLSFWDTSSGQVLTALAQDSWVSALACHPDPSHVATGHDDGTVRFWDAAGHHLKLTLRGTKQAISALAFSPDGKFLAAASEDKIITLWDLGTGKPLGVLKGHSDRIPALAWHPGGKYLVSAGWDTTARVWDTHTLQPLILLNSHSAQVTAVAFNADGSLLACGDSSLSVHVWDFDAKKELQVLKGPEVEIRCLAFSPDSLRLASSGDHIIHLWDPRSGASLAGTSARQLTRTALALSPDGARLATNGGGLAPRVWDTARGTILCSLEQSDTVEDLAWSSQGNVIAGAAGERIDLWDASTGKKKKCELDGPEDPITRVALSPDGSLLASASNRGLDVWLWRVADGEPILVIPDALEGCAVETLAFHPTQSLLAVGGIDHMATGGSSGAICLWDYVERCEVTTFLGGTLALVFHPSGKRLASTSLDQSICIWDLESKLILMELTGHDGPLTALAYSPDGQYLASAGEDRTLRLWNHDGDELINQELDTQITSLAFSRDGQFLYTGNANTTCFQFKVAELLAGR